MKFSTQLLALALTSSVSFAANAAASLSSVATADMSNLGWVTIAPLCTDFGFGGAQANCQGTYSFSSANNPDGSDLNYQATASSDWGVLKVYAASSITHPTSSGSPTTLDPYYSSTIANANWRDQWTIVPWFSVNEPTGTLELSFDLSGTFTSQDGSWANGGISLYNYTTNTHVSDPSGMAPQIGSGSFSQTATLTMQFTYGQTFDFVTTLSSSSTLGVDAGGYDGQSSFLDMSNSAILNAIVVKDGNGNVVPFTLTTASGATLFNELAPVPEPETYAMMLAGLGLVGWVALRRKQIH